ncbi:hypothetical protein ACVINI_000367 [Rhizobium beringeri]|jgi:hypothetical protein
MKAFIASPALLIDTALAFDLPVARAATLKRFG